MNSTRVVNNQKNNSLYCFGWLAKKSVERRSLLDKGGLKSFYMALTFLVVLFAVNNSLFAQGYTTPADENSNGVYDFLEAGSEPVIVTQPSNQLVCGGGTSDVSVIATGVQLSYQWQVSTNGGSVFNNIVVGGSNPTYTGFTGATLTVSSLNTSMDQYQYRVIVYSDTYACDSTISSPSVFTINTPPTAPTASAQDFCDNTSHLVSDLSPNGAGINWFTASTGGTPIVGATTLSTGTYYVSETNGVCEGPRTAVSVTVNAAPGAPNADAQEFCSGSSPLVSDLVVTSGSNIKWYTTSTGGTELAGSTALNNTSYYVSQSIGTCESARTEVVVTLFISPNPPTADAQDFCSNANATVADLIVTSGTGIEWYNMATGGSPLSAGTTLSSGTYYASSISGICESSRIAVVVTADDTIDPVVTCEPTLNAYLDGTGNVTLNPIDLVASGSDNCGVNTYTVVPSSFTCAEIGINSVVVTATDPNGNEATCNSSVTVVDDTNPTIFCQDYSGVLDASGDLSIALFDVILGGSDNCTIPTFNMSQSSFNCSEIGLNTITISATDPTGNMVSCTSNVTVQDATPPIAVCRNVTISLDSLGDASIVEADIDDGSTDNCSVNLSASQTSFTSANLGMNFVTLTVDDGNGNSSTCTAQVVVEDDSDPIAICQDVTVFLDGSGNASVAASEVDNGSTDNGSILFLSTDVKSFGCADIGSNSVVLTVTDDAINTATCMANITVLDSIAPTISCGPFSTNLDLNGLAIITSSNVVSASGDNCSLSSISLSQSVFHCSDIGVNSIVITSSDASGNSTNCIADVTINDITNPIAICQDTIAVLDGMGNATILESNVDGGSSDNCSIANLSLNQSSFNSANVGANTVTLTVTDAAGLISTCDAIVTVVDPSPPVALCQDITVNLDAVGVVNIVPADIDNGSSDNVAIASMSLDTTSFDCSDLGTNPVVLTVTDDAANESTCAAIVTIVDNENPTLVCQDYTAELDETGFVSITSSNVLASIGENCTITSLVLSQSTFDCSEIGSHNVTCTTTDQSGNVASCISNVTVEDNLDPLAICQDITIALDGLGNASIVAADIDGGSSDNCSIATLSASQTSFTSTNAGSNTVTLTVTDVNGNTSNCNAQVTITDDLGPTAVCQDISVFLNGSGIASVVPADIDNGSTDNVGIEDMSLDIMDFDCSDLGLNSVVLTVKDDASNMSVCTAVVHVIDNEDPTVVCQDYTAELDATGSVTISAVDVVASGSDNCANITYSLSQSTFDCSEVGLNTITITAADQSSNIATCSSTVTVEDNIAPVAICQDVPLVLDATGNANIVAFDLDNGSSDNCGIASFSVNQSSFSGTDVGSNTVTLTVTDVNSNSTNCTAQVIVTDNVGPTAACNDITVQLDNLGFVTVLPSQIDFGSTDNVGIASMTLDIEDFDCSNIGPNNVTLTVTDDASNMSVCLAVVEVEDSTNPIIICQPDTAHLGSDGMVTISEDDVISSSSDNCGIVGFAFSRQTFNCTHIGSNSVTITASDNSSNSGTCVSEVTVADTLSPNVSCIDITVGLDSLGNASIIPSQVDNGSTDNCLIDTYSLSQTDFVVTDLGPNNVILTVVDINGNSSNCTSIVTVTDSDPPVAICQAITVPLDASGAASIADIDIDGGSTDNGSIVNWSASQTAFDCSHLGNNAVVLTVMDDGGNDNSCSANVLVIDVIDPTVSCADVTISLDAAGEAAISASDVITASADNCGIVNESIDLDTFDCSNIGTSSVVVMVIDDSGNSSDCSADVTIQDNTSPVTLCQDIAINLDSLGNASIAAADIDFGTTDNCGLDSLTADITSFTNANLGLNTVLLTATDINGNVSTCTSIVTVQDGQAPNAICQNISVELDATGIASITPSDIDNGSTDNGVITDLSLDVSDFDCSNLGNNTVTLSVTDNGSNVSSCNAFVTVVDIDAPSVVCTDFIAQLNDLGEVVIDSADVVTSSDDNCGIIAYAFSQSIFGCGDITDHDVVVTVMDDSGNSANCTSVVTVQDTISPLANCMDISVGLDASGNASIIPLQLDNGSDDACGIDSYSLSQSNFTTADFGTNSVTLTVTDVNLNSSSCISNVTITDDIDPVAVCQDIQIDLDSISGTNSIIAADINNGSTDNGTIVSMIASQTSFSCTDVGVNSVTLTVTDESGNFSTCFAQVHVQENVLPSASCQDVIIVLDAISGEATITSSDIDNGSFDACGINSLVLSNTTFSPIGTYSTELTVEDFNGNSNSCNATVEVVDAIDPPIAVCHDIIVALDSNGEASITPQDIDGGSSDNVSIVNYTASQLDYSCANIGTSDILLTVEDTDGFEDNCIAEVTVEDNLAPNVTCQPLTLELDESGLATLIPMDAVLDYSDNCSVDITASQTGFNVNNLGSNDIVITATDGNANNTNCTSVVTVVDNIIPELVCNDLTIPLDENGQAAVTANTIGNGSSDNHILLFTSANLNLDCSDIGEMNYTLMAEDPSGNMSSCEAVISVVDNMAPLVQCNDFTVTLNDLNPIAVQLSEVSTGSTDNCSISDLVMDVNTFGINEIGQNVVTITATDLSGNEGTCQSMVTVESTLAPKAICQDVTVSLDQNGLVVVLASEVDNGSSDAIAINNMVLSQSSFDCSNVGDNTVQLTVTNTIGISTDCSAIITVEDDLAPVVVCPDDKEFVNDLGQCGAIVVYDDFTVTDNCSVFGETLIQGQPSGTFFEIGVTTIELRYSDEKANETSCVFDVIVIDAELPTISCPDDIVTEEAVVIYDVPVFNDNCSADLNQIDGLVSGSTFAHGNNAIEFVATDLEGNIAECSFNILVNQDAIANNDSINASMNNDGVDINPLVNDFDPDGDEILITNADASIGHVVIENGTNLVYTPLSDWCGTDSIQYEISDEFNGRTTATIYIEVDCEVVLFFPEGISPNGDGINDYFEIVGIEDYPEAELNIYNRWGRIVYQTIGYDNSWNGTISNNFTLGRKILPQGTYFYNLKVDEETPVVKGYFYISLEKE